MKNVILSAIIGLILSTNSMAWTLFDSSAPSCEDDNIRGLIIESERVEIDSLINIFSNQTKTQKDSMRQQLIMQFFPVEEVDKQIELIYGSKEMAPESLLEKVFSSLEFNPLNISGSIFKYPESVERMVIISTRTDSKDDDLSKAKCTVRFSDPVTSVVWGSPYNLWKSDGKIYVESSKKW